MNLFCDSINPVIGIGLKANIRSRDCKKCFFAIGSFQEDLRKTTYYHFHLNRRIRTYKLSSGKFQKNVFFYGFSEFILGIKYFNFSMNVKGISTLLLLLSCYCKLMVPESLLFCVTTRVNFINILPAHFSYESLLTAFLCLEFGFEQTFVQKMRK
jgi:hypothetical protein